MCHRYCLTTAPKCIALQTYASHTSLIETSHGPTDLDALTDPATDGTATYLHPPHLRWLHLVVRVRKDYDKRMKSVERYYKSNPDSRGRHAQQT